MSNEAELGGSGDDDIEVHDYSSMRVAEIKQGLRSRGFHSGGTKPP
jgi:hypothetical protein